MRQIGTLPKSADPSLLVDHLFAQGVTTRAIESPEGWAIWVHNEDLIPTARAEFETFQTNPDDPRFLASSKAASAARREQERLEQRYRKNVRDVSDTWNGLHVRRRPLTLALVAACIAIYLIGEFNPRAYLILWDHLAFFSHKVLLNQGNLSAGLVEIERGEVWRLFTPILLHVNIAHLVMNVWATLSAGSLIETRKGTGPFALIVLVSALVSNLGQFLWIANADQELRWWGGISGVGFALFGYIWVKGVFQPEEGMGLDRRTIRLLLLWLLLGFAGVLNMANGAHLFGLFAGLLLGYLGV